MTRTWENLGIEEMRRAILLMQQGNAYFAWQLPNGVYRPCYNVEQLTRSDADIFEGHKTPGFYAIRPDNNTRWGALDFDNHDGSKSRKYWLSDAQRAFDRLAAQLAECWVVESSPGGYHVIVFADAPIAAADMRRILKPHAPTGVEVFPKQDKLRADDPNAKGSLLRFPCRHQFRRCWSKILATTGRVINADAPQLPQAAKWEAQGRGAQFLSLYAQVTRGIRVTGKSQRFNPMQTIVGRLKGRTFDEEIAREIHDRFYGENEAYFTMPIDKSRACFMTWFRKANPCNIEIPDYPPTQAQQMMINALPKLPDIRPELLADTVRLFLSAKRYADEQGRELFLSLPYLARRLGVASYATASKYRDACYKIGLIAMVERGSYVSGRASTYILGREWEGESIP